MASERQADSMVRLYESRATEYDNTWHPSFAKRFAEYLNLSPGQHVLDLACGTGLLSFLEADAVGAAGSVIGIDVTPGMLAEARTKKERGGYDYAHVEFYEGDALNLEKVQCLRGKSFDVITMASALVLFPDPVAAIQYWASYLKPGGILAMDSTHPQNLVPGMVLERTGSRFGVHIPYYRQWSQSENSLKEVMAAAGLEVEKIITVDNQSGDGKQQYHVSEAADLFTQTLANGNAANAFADSELRSKAQSIFCEEFEKLAVNGKVEEVDAVFLGIARKPLHSSNVDKEVVLSGGCRCGGVRYISTAPPSGITYCHCRACQQLSGSAFIPFVGVSKDSFKFLTATTLTKLKLSTIAERTFCSSCGTPISMEYFFEGGDEDTSITVGSIDMHRYNDEMPKTRQHIFVSEKAPWFAIPDDGAPQHDTMRSLSHLSQSEYVHNAI